MAQVDINKNNNAVSLAKYTKHRLTVENLNALNVFIGQTGSGKSLATAAYSGMVDPTFFDDMERVIFGPKDYFHKIKEMKTGESLDYEEAGVTLAARDFQKRIVKMVAAVNQTFRHRNLCVTFNVPSMAFIEMQVRDLMHMIVWMRQIDRDTSLSMGKVFKIDHNPLYGKTQLSKYEFETYGGKRHVIDSAWFPLPPKKWVDEYEKMKFDFTQNLYDTYEAEALAMEEGKNLKKDYKLIQTQQAAFFNLIEALNKDVNMTWAEIAKKCKISERTLYYWKPENI